MAFTERFQYSVDTGSRIRVVDPVTNETKEGYISGFPSASSREYFDALWPDKFWPIFSTYTSAWSENLQKFLVGGTNGAYTEDQSVYMVVLDGQRSKWVTASMAGTSLPTDHVIENIVCADTSPKCVATVWYDDGVYNTSSIIYSDNGQTWYTSSFSKITNGADKRLLDMSWSPTTNTFVGVGLSSSLGGVMEYTVTSSNGSDWHFTVISQSLTNRNLDYRNIAWSPTHNKFLLYGDAGYNPTSVSASLYSSSNGVSWGFVTSHSFGNNSTGPIIKLTEQNGNVIAVGYNYYNNTTLLYTSNLTNWTAVNTGHSSMHDIKYVSAKNKYFAAAQSGSNNSTNQITISTSSNLIDWGTFLVDPRNGTYTTQFRSIHWSTDTSSSVAIAGQNLPYWLYSDTNEDYVYYGLEDDDAVYVSFAEEPSNTILNTPLTPWTSSIDTGNGYFDDLWQPFNSDTAYTWIEFDLAISAGVPGGYGPQNSVYVPTSSYGIIIDSSSLSQFNSYPDSYMEDVEVDGVRYLQEISQEEGNEYAKYNYGYYETAEPATVFNTATSSFSAALKANGRDYVNIYYSVSGDNYMGESVAMILNIKDGIVDYYEDTTNAYAEGTYYMAGNTKLKFIEGPTLTSKGDGYWQLDFKVTFDRGNRTRSGSISVT